MPIAVLKCENNMVRSNLTYSFSNLTYSLLTTQPPHDGMRLSNIRHGGLDDSTDASSRYDC